MSRASNLAGFTTAVGPPTDLNVGVISATSISAQTITSTDTYSFTNLDIGESISVGSSIVGVTTINSSGINSPLGVSTLGQVEIAGITTINSDGVQSTGIGTFNFVAIGTDSSNPLEVYHPTSNTVARFKSGDAGVNIRFQDGDTTNQMGIGADNNDFVVTAASGGERVRVQSGGNVGLGSTAPTVSVDISEKTDAVALPVGTTAQRPSTAYGGYIRWNSTSSALEVYNGTNWVEIISDYFPSGSTTLG
jgi:hypothetical protein